MRIKGYIAAITAAALVSGCSIKPSETASGTAEGSSSQESTEASSIVAAPANGAEGMEITRDEYLPEYLYYLARNGYGTDTDEETLADAQQQVIDGIIEDKIIRAKFEEYGLELTDSEKRQIRDDTDTGIEAIKSSIRSSAQSSDDTLTDEELDELTSERYNDLLETCGITEDMFYAWQEALLMKEKVTEKISESAEVTDEELSEQLQMIIAAAKELYEESPAEFNGQAYSGVWIPDGSRKIQAILIGFDSDTYTEISALRSSGDDDGADSLREESLSTLRERYEQVMARIVAGDDFAELMEEFNEDEGNGTFLITPGTEIYGTDILECAMGITSAGGTDTAVTDYGYYILRYAEDAVVTDEALEAAAEQVREYLLEQEITELYSTELEKWKTEYAYETEDSLLGI